MSHPAKLQVIDAAEAASLAERFDASYLQQPSYALCAAQAVRAHRELIAIEHEGEIIGFCAVRVRRLPLIGGGLAYVHGGPAISRSPVEEKMHRWDLSIAALADRYVANRRMILRIAPPFRSRDAVQGANYGSVLRKRGFVEVHAPVQRTILLDLSPALPDIRRAFEGKWRNQLSRGERDGLCITRSSNPADFDRFAPLLNRLELRKGFVSPRDTAFFKRAAAGANSGERICIHLARKDGKVVAGHIGAFSGTTAVYLLGAASDAGRATRAAFVLQWAVIQYAKSLGIETYDLGGIDEVKNPGVFHFKKGMGGRIHQIPSAFDLKGGGLSQSIVTLANQVRTRLRCSLQPQPRVQD